jgi:tetratricopeptide (TPR) repeat protein
LAIGLSYFGLELTQADIAASLRNHPADKNVSLHELVGYAADAGVSARARINGDLDLVRRLINGGIPVLTEGWLRVGEDVGHYRLVRGYDLETGELLTQDSYHGPDIWVSGEDFEAMWRPFFFAYAPLYRPEQEPLVAAIVGADWYDTAMASRALEDAQEAVDVAPDDPFGWYNLGTARFLHEDFDGAVSAFERSVSIGLPSRFFWYQFDFFAALNATGRHQRVLELTTPLITQVDSLAELYIERGYALAALGQKHEAVAAYEQALLYTPDQEEVRAILAELQ